MRTWIDENTGRTVYAFIEGPLGSGVSYFRFPRLLPGGLILAKSKNFDQPLITIHPDSGEVQPFPYETVGILNICLSQDRLWFIGADRISIWSVVFPDGVPEFVGELPPHSAQGGAVITCDGSSIVWEESEVEMPEKYPMPQSMDAEELWSWIDRPRRGKLMAHNLKDKRTSTIVELEGMAPTHHDVSPVDPMLIKFAHDQYDAFCQRIWTIRLDGRESTKIRPQQYGELITHEFWWPDGQSVAFKYQDRRNDPTIRELPWAEYSPIPTQFGLATLDGRQHYLSDPLNHYHSHIYTSLDGSMLCGEGTDGHSFVYAAAFSPHSTHVDFIPHATIHTEYLPFRGQGVNAGFSADGRWLIYNDTIEGVRQVCAVKVDL